MIIPLLFFIVTSFPSTHLSSVSAPVIALPAPDTMGEYVRQYYADVPVLANIAWCESRFRQWDADGATFRGAVNRSDVGIMQINVLYHANEAKALGLDLYSLSGNLEFARRLYDAEGTEPWSSSESCWDKFAGK